MGRSKAAREIESISASSGPSDEILLNSSDVNFLSTYGWTEKDVFRLEITVGDVDNEQV